MIKLISPTVNNEVDVVITMLIDFSLAYSFEVSDEIEDLTLYDGDVAYLGLADIRRFLDALSGELHLWQYARC